MNRFDSARLLPARHADGLGPRRRFAKAARAMTRAGAVLALTGFLALAPSGAAVAQMPFLGSAGAPPPAGPFTAPPPMSPRPLMQNPVPSSPGGAGAGINSALRDPHAILPPAPAGKTALGLYARFAADASVIPRGVVWRVFADQPEANGSFPLVAESQEATPVFFLSPGGYIIHASYGFANKAERLQLSTMSRREAIILPAGGLRLQSDVESKMIAAQKVTYEIFEGSFLQGRTSSQPYWRGTAGSELIVLPEGTYHVVSTYGDANAVVRADVNVVPGKLIDATMHHRAAQVMLKLVKEKGGEAQADTQWTVITPGGDTIKESIGAFPVVILSEGEYTAIARNGGRSFSREFKVEPGKDMEVEVTSADARRIGQTSANKASGDD